jgi:hypothetical protein
MTILEEDFKEITKKLYAQLIPSRGANHNFPGVFQHVPNAFFGIALPHSINDQFIGQVKKFLIHGAIFPILTICAISHWSRHRWKWASALQFWK